jgi:hypothetical protein
MVGLVLVEDMDRCHNLLPLGHHDSGGCIPHLFHLKGIYLDQLEVHEASHNVRDL